MKMNELATVYGIEPASLRMLTSGFHNTVYEGTQKGKKVILRASSTTRRDLNAVRGELDWLLFLGRQEIPVSLPIPTVEGQLAVEAELDPVDGMASGGSVILSAFEFAPGTLVNVQDSSEWNASFFKNWGELIGRIHAASKGYLPTDPAIRRPNWNRENHGLLEIRNHFAKKEGSLAAKCDFWLSKIESLPITEDTYGLIHNDFHQGNIHVHRGQITAFDFDESLYGWLANDLAVPFYHAYWHATWSQPDIRLFAEVFMQNFLEGYSRANTLNKETVEQIPLFLKWREVFLLYLFETRWDLEQLEGWQAEKLKELKECLLYDTPYSHLNFERMF